MFHSPTTWNTLAASLLPCARLCDCKRRMQIQMKKTLHEGLRCVTGFLHLPSLGMKLWVLCMALPLQFNVFAASLQRSLQMLVLQHRFLILEVAIELSPRNYSQNRNLACPHVNRVLIHVSRKTPELLRIILIFVHGPEKSLSNS